MEDGVFLRRSDQRRLEGAPVSNQLVADFGPGTDVEQHACDVHGAMDREAADGLDDVALANASFRAGRISDHVPGSHALGRVHPSDAIIGKNIKGALLEVQDSEDNSRQCEEG